jgi:hypothetical protein
MCVFPYAYQESVSLRLASITIEPQAYEAAALFLSDTFEQLNLLNNDTGGGDFDDRCDNSQNNISPNL